MSKKIKQELLDRFGHQNKQEGVIFMGHPRTIPVESDFNKVSLCNVIQNTAKKAWDDLMKDCSTARNESEQQYRERMIDMIRQNAHQNFVDSQYQEAAEAGSSGPTKIVADGVVLNHLSDTTDFKPGEMYEVEIGETK